MRRGAWLAALPSVLVLIPVVVFVGVSGNDRERLPSALIGQKFPEFELPMLGSERIATHRLLEGKPRLVNVWGTWCAACREEHGLLLKIAREFGIEIVGVNYRDDPDQAVAWLRDLGSPYVFDVLDREGSLGVDLGVYGAPETFLVDSERRIVLKHVGRLTPKVWADEFEPRIEGMQ